MEANPLPRWTDGNCITHGNASMRVENLVHRCGSSRCEGAPYGRSHHESRLIDKNQMFVTSASFTVNSRKLLFFPSGDLDLVAFCRLLHRSARGPPKIISQDVPHLNATE